MGRSRDTGGHTSTRTLALLMPVLVLFTLMTAARSEAVHACRTAQLKVTPGHSFAGLGTSGENIRLTNVSRVTCELHGWPTLIAETARGAHVHALDRAGMGFPDRRTVRTALPQAERGATSGPQERHHLGVDLVPGRIPALLRRDPGVAGPSPQRRRQGLTDR